MHSGLPPGVRVEIGAAAEDPALRLVVGGDQHFLPPEAEDLEAAVGEINAALRRAECPLRVTDWRTGSGASGEACLELVLAGSDGDPPDPSAGEEAGAVARHVTEALARLAPWAGVPRMRCVKCGRAVPVPATGSGACGCGMRLRAEQVLPLPGLPRRLLDGLVETAARTFWIDAGCGEAGGRSILLTDPVTGKRHDLVPAGEKGLEAWRDLPSDLAEWVRWPLQACRTGSGEPYWVLPRQEGEEPLEDHLATSARIPDPPLELGLRAGRGMVAVLERVHESGWVLALPAGEAFLLRSGGADEQVEVRLAGPHALARAGEGGPGRRADVYSLSLTLYWLLSGLVPCRLPDGRLPPLPPLAAIFPHQAPPGVEAVLRRGMVPEASLRFASGGVLRRAFDRALEELALRVGREQTPLRVTHASALDLGRVKARAGTVNQDAVATGSISVEDGTGQIIWGALADGVSECESGEVAARCVVAAARTVFRRARGAHPGGLPYLIPAAVNQASRLIHRCIEVGQRRWARVPEGSPEKVRLAGWLRRQSQRPMTTTCLLLLIHDGVLLHGRLGDSRILLARHGLVECLTADQDEYVRLVMQEGLTLAESAQRREHTWLSALGTVGGFSRSVEDPDRFDLDVVRQFGHEGVETMSVTALPLLPGDTICAASDGLTDLVSEEAIAAVLSRRSLPLPVRAQALVDLANRAGGHDNIAVALFELEAAGDQG